MSWMVNTPAFAAAIEMKRQTQGSAMRKPQLH